MAAMKKSAELKKAGISVESALAAEEAQKASTLPSLQASASLSGISASLAPGTSPLSGSPGTISAGLSSSVKLWDGGQAAILLEIDRLATSAARSAAREAYFALLEEADDAYYAVLAGRDSVEAARSDLEASDLSLSIAKAKLETGVITRADLLKVQAEAASKETALSQATHSLQSAMMQLASMTGLSLPFELAPVDFDSLSGLMERLAAIEDSALEDFVGSVQDSGLKNNPSIGSAQLAADKARLAIDSVRNQYGPSVSASASGSAKYAIAGDPSVSLSLGITASLPLDAWNREPALKAKELALETATVGLDEAKRSLELEVRTAAYSWVASARSVRSSAKAFEYAESNYEAVLESYRLSLAGVSDLSDATILVSTSKNTLNASKYAFLKAFAALKSLAGIERDADLVGLLKE